MTGDLPWRSDRDHLPSLIAGPRTDLDHPIARCDHAHVVLDDDDGTAGLHQVRDLATDFNLSMGPLCGSKGIS